MTWRRASHCSAQIIIKHSDVVKFIGHWALRSNRDCQSDPTGAGSWVKEKQGEWQETGERRRDDREKRHRGKRDEMGVIELRNDKERERWMWEIVKQKRKWESEGWLSEKKRFISNDVCLPFWDLSCYAQHHVAMTLKRLFFGTPLSSKVACISHRIIVI